ncbi:uncharacterized protein A4U43_C05F35610 [Asparagus officinalis]|uniref:NET domain-containing protein n=1 Tax=Asparagus officinalis TaxID=4686 RepID=A0A5P1EZP2_ASPOF|nr:uncharacterized protein A4U43_C05F35610 [Asparagus officinalis]
MTFEEKQKLSNNLQNLPLEKLDNVVQIIKKRNSSLSQHDDEIVVDIDSVDTETLWELDRFVTNYKKSLSKNKRKPKLGELALQFTFSSFEQNSDAVVAEVPTESRTVVDEKHAASSPLQAGEKKGDNASRSSSSSSSGNETGSSSSDSDSDSSSAGSDAAQSPRT